MKFIPCALLFLISVLAVPCRAISVAPPSFAKLVANAEQIARVKITAVDSRWDSGPQGDVIHTYVQCQVLRMLKGTPQETMTVRMLGGQVGSDRMMIPGLPSFDVGGTYILFIAENGASFCPLVGIMHGSYRVLTDGATGVEHVARSNGEPLHAAQDVVRPMTESAAPATAQPASGMTRDAFETAILHELDHASNQ